MRRLKYFILDGFEVLAKIIILALVLTLCIVFWPLTIILAALIIAGR